MGAPPFALRNRKKLRQDCTDYMHAFHELHPTRMHNEGGHQPLQPSEISAYLPFLGISGEEAKAKFFRLMLSMDQAYMNHHFEQQAKASAKS